MKKRSSSGGYSKGDVITLSIADLSDNGNGIGFDSAFSEQKESPADRGLVFFVKGAVPGDTIEALVTKVTSHCGYARLNRIITPSPDRADPFCHAASSCGGCQLQNLSYSAELEWKQKRVRDALIRIGGFDGSLIDRVLTPIHANSECEHASFSASHDRTEQTPTEIISFSSGNESSKHMPAEAPFFTPRYRNKVQMPVGTGRDGEIRAGFFAARTHSIIPVGDCPLCHESAAEATGIILDLMNKYHIPSYDEKTGSGLLRHIFVRRGFHSGEVCVCLVINSRKPLPHMDELADRLFDGIPGMTSLSYCPNTARTNVILGDEVIPVRGEPFITDTMCGLKFVISPLAFYQVNTPQAERLYEQALGYAGLTGSEHVIDLYCGIGTMTLAAARRAAHVTGVEIVPDAVKCAKENARANGIENAEFIAESAEDVLPALADRGLTPDVLIVDPPRAGLAVSCTDAVLSLSPSRIVYVSCNPSTLARDLKLLSGAYRLTAARPFDMFSKTCHTEVCCLLTRN